MVAMVLRRFAVAVGGFVGPPVLRYGLTMAWLRGG
jgi:hypothetical protein